MKKKICNSILETIGDTPLVKLNSITAGTNLTILTKFEFFSPSGSLKDRILLRIIESAEKKGKLKKGMSIIEGTTGNTGISTSMIGAVKGYKVVICMPSGMSEERKKVMRAYGAEIIETPGAESDVDLVLKQVKKIIRQDPSKYFFINQFSNKENSIAHYTTTAKEIWKQTNGEFDAFIVSQGTGGTISGVAKLLKKKKPSIKIYAIEPAECPLLSQRKWGTHRIEGIGDGFIPRVLDVSLLDGIVTTTSEESIEMAKRLAKEEGIFCGISSGCNIAGALKLYKKHPELKTIVTMICDNGFRYFSTALCGEEKELEIPEREHPIDAHTQKNLDKYQNKWDIIN